MFENLLTVFHISICVILVMIVLLQQGRGADMGAAFGGGSNTLFGASGADTLLTKVTTTVAILFMVSSMVLAFRAKIPVTENGSTFTDFDSPPAAEAPAVPGSTESPVAASPVSETETTSNATDTAAPSLEPHATVNTEGGAENITTPSNNENAAPQ